MNQRDIEINITPSKLHCGRFEDLDKSPLRENIVYGKKI
jgi:hypothetical protein